METTSSVAPPAPSEPSFLARHQFAIIRLFSLTGLLPIGGYLCVHLLTNATVINGAAAYQENVDRIHSLGKVLWAVEWLFIFLPLMFHAVVGWMIISGAVPNTNAYPYASNMRYTLQRGTGIVAFFFILFHLLHMHKVIGSPVAWLGGAAFDPHHATSSAAAALQAALWLQIFYAVGILASVYHLANGLWTFGIRWGLWTSPAAQRRASYVSLAFGLALGAVGLSSLGAMADADIQEAKQVELRMEYARKITTGELPLPTAAAENKPTEK